MSTRDETRGRWFAAQRHAARCTQAEFAEELKVTVTTVQNWERGIGIPRVSTQRLLAEKFAIVWDAYGNVVPNEFSALVANTLVVDNARTLPSTAIGLPLARPSHRVEHPSKGAPLYQQVNGLAEVDDLVAVDGDAVLGKSTLLPSAEPARVAGVAHAQDRLPPFDVQRQTDGMTLVDVAIRTGHGPSIVALVGDAGLGKSATLAAAFFRWTTDDGWGAFAQCALDSEDWAASPYAQLERLLGVVTHAWIESATAENKVPAVFFDTLDMITGPRTATVIVRFLVALVHAGASVVVSCRTTEMVYVQQALRSMSKSCALTRIDVPRFGASEIVEFVKRFTETRSQLPHVDEFVASVAELAHRPQMVSVLGVPLLLSTMCRVYCGRGELPQNLTLSSLYDAVYNDKVCEARTPIGRVDTPLLRMNVCARVGTELLQRSTDRLQLSTNGVADWTLAPGIADALASLVSEVVLVRPRANALEFFHQSFAEYMIGQLLSTDTELGRIYLRRFAADPAAHHWLAPIFRFALARGGRRAITDAAAVLPLDDELALRPLVMAMAEAAPELLPTYATRANTEGQRMVLAEALASLGAHPGFDVTIELLALARPADHDEASLVAIRAVASRVAAAEASVAATRQVLLVLRNTCRGPRVLEETLITALANEPRGMATLVGLTDMLSSLAGPSRFEVARAVVETGSPADVERAMSLLVTTKSDRDEESFVELIHRYFADVFLRTPHVALDAIRTVVMRVEDTPDWRRHVRWAAGRQVLALKSREITDVLVAAAYASQPPSTEMREVLRCMAKLEGGSSLVWNAIRKVPSWWLRSDSKEIGVTLAFALRADPKLKFDELEADEQVALDVRVRRPRVVREHGRFRPVGDLHRDLWRSGVDEAMRAYGELFRMVEANQNLDVVQMLGPAFRSRHVEVRERAIFEAHFLTPPAAITLLAGAAIEATSPVEWIMALVMIRDRASASGPEARSSYLTLRWLSCLGAKLRFSDVLRNEGAVIREWLEVWRGWSDAVRERDSDRDAWKVFEADYAFVDVGVAQEDTGALSVVLRRFFVAGPERAEVLANGARELPTANVIAVIRATQGVDDVRERVLSVLAHDERDEVRRVVSRVRLGMEL